MAAQFPLEVRSATPRARLSPVRSRRDGTKPHRSLWVPVVLLVGAMASFPTWAWADVTEGPPARGVGRPGRPLSECRSFVLTEVAGYFLLNEEPIQGGNNLELTCDAGWMRNVSPHDAVGGTVFAGMGAKHLRGGVRARYRRWLGNAVSVDLTAGLVLLEREESSANAFLPNPVAGVALDLSDLLSVSLEAQSGRYSHWEMIGPGSYERREFDVVNWRVGGRVGSVPGVVGTALFIAAASIWSQVQDWD